MVAASGRAPLLLSADAAAASIANNGAQEWVGYRSTSGRFSSITFFVAILDVNLHVPSKAAPASQQPATPPQASGKPVAASSE